MVEDISDSRIPTKRLMRTNRTNPITTNMSQPVDLVREYVFTFATFFSPKPAKLLNHSVLLFLVLVIVLVFHC